MVRKRIFSLALLFGTVLSGCGDETTAARDGYEIANRIVAQDVAAGGTPAGPNDIPLQLATTDCTVQVSTDEYGFESETLVCADASDQPASPSAADLLAAPGWMDIGYYPALVSSLPDKELADAMTTLGSKLDQIEAACGLDESAWIEALEAYVNAAEATREIATVERLGPYQGSVEASALSRALVERALMGSGCAQPEPVSVGDDPELLSLLAATVDVTVGMDNTLRNSTYGPLFHLYSTLPNYLWMRNEQEGVDAVFLGTSQLGAAVDLAEVNRVMATEVGSAWIPGALAEVQRLWVDEVIRYSDPQTFVWFIGPLDLFAECDTTNRGVEFQRLADARSATFARGFVVGADPIDRILGPVTPEVTVRGDGIKREGFDEEGTANHRAQYVPAFAEGRFCHERAQIVAETVARLTSDGRSVLIVGMPVHPELRAARPDTKTEMAMFADRYLSDTDVIDLTDTVADEALWSDFTHLTVEGAGIFTEILVPELERAGLR